MTFAKNLKHRYNRNDLFGRVSDGRPLTFVRMVSESDNYVANLPSAPID
jgi:hypothetical protein